MRKLELASLCSSGQLDDMVLLNWFLALDVAEQTQREGTSSGNNTHLFVSTRRHGKDKGGSHDVLLC